LVIIKALRLAWEKMLGEGVERKGQRMANDFVRGGLSVDQKKTLMTGAGVSQDVAASTMTARINFATMEEEMYCQWVAYAIEWNQYFQGQYLKDPKLTKTKSAELPAAFWSELFNERTAVDMEELAALFDNSDVAEYPKLVGNSIAVFEEVKCRRAMLKYILTALALKTEDQLPAGEFPQELFAKNWQGFKTKGKKSDGKAKRKVVEDAVLAFKQRAEDPSRVVVEEAVEDNGTIIIAHPFLEQRTVKVTIARGDVLGRQVEGATEDEQATQLDKSVDEEGEGEAAAVPVAAPSIYQCLTNAKVQPSQVAMFGASVNYGLKKYDGDEKAFTAKDYLVVLDQIALFKTTDSTYSVIWHCDQKQLLEAQLAAKERGLAVQIITVKLEGGCSPVGNCYFQNCCYLLVMFYSGGVGGSQPGTIFHFAAGEDRTPVSE
jgi:hypothetical protein